MKTVKCGNRVWHTLDDVSPDAWTVDPVLCQQGVFKQSSTRTVSRITLPSGEGYFIKQYVCRSLWDRLFPKAEREFRSAELLRKNGIPSAEYVGWCAARGNSTIVSRALSRDWIGFPEFWFSCTEHGIHCRLLGNTGFLLASLIEKRIYHSDFHIGNLMVNKNDLSLCLVDPGGIRKTLYAPSPDSMASCFMDLRGAFSLDEQAEILSETPLLNGNTEKIREFLNRSSERASARLDREWPRRKSQILSGSSKFARETAPGHWERNSAWYAPVPLPGPEDLETVRLPSAEAEELWLNSFRLFLEGKDIEKIPLVYEKNGVFAVIRVLKTKKMKNFYGFHGK